MTILKGGKVVDSREALDQAVFLGDLATIVDGLLLGSGLVSAIQRFVFIRVRGICYSRVNLRICSVVVEGNLSEKKKQYQ
jgi:hypothetical protein